MLAGASRGQYVLALLLLISPISVPSLFSLLQSIECH